MNLKNHIPSGFLFSLQIDDRHAKHSTKKPPRISIVMPSFNQAKFIEQSILSVINQNYPNLEFIIIDGGSSDGTVDIIKKHEQYLTYWVSEPDQGQSDALNKGFLRATGDIFGWLNSDDIYLPNAFLIAAKSFENNPYAQIIFGDWLSIDEHGKTLDLNHAFDFNLNHFKYEGFHLNAQSMFWRSDVHSHFPGFDIDLHNTMDYQMIMEFGIKQGQKAFLRIPFVLGAFRRYEGQKTSGFTARVIEEHKSIAEKYGYFDKYRFVGKLKRLVFRFRRAWWYLKRGGLAVLAIRVQNWLSHASRT